MYGKEFNEWLEKPEPAKKRAAMIEKLQKQRQQKEEYDPLLYARQQESKTVLFREKYVITSIEELQKQQELVDIFLNAPFEEITKIRKNADIDGSGQELNEQKLNKIRQLPEPQRQTTAKSWAQCFILNNRDSSRAAAIEKSEKQQQQV